MPFCDSNFSHSFKYSQIHSNFLNQGYRKKLALAIKCLTYNLRFPALNPGEHHLKPDPGQSAVSGFFYLEQIMAGITLAQAEEQLSTWMAANLAVASGQSYTIGNRSLTRANAAEIREQIVFWDNQIKRLSRGGIRIYGGTPV